MPNLTSSGWNTPEGHFRCTRCFKQNRNLRFSTEKSTNRDNPSVLSARTRKQGLVKAPPKSSPTIGFCILQWTIRHKREKCDADPARMCKSAAHVALTLQFDRKRRDLPPTPSPLSARLSHFLRSLLREGRGGPHRNLQLASYYLTFFKPVPGA